MKRPNKKQPVDLLLLMGIVFAASVSLCLLAYRTDNKYTYDGLAGYGGVLTLNEQDVLSGKPVFLISGWEYYGGRLLTPEDFAESPPEPDQYIFIGQYGGFEAGDVSASPHGSASYRLTIQLPGELRSYMLEFPEIFSAYRSYVNGSLVMAMGDPSIETYSQETGNRFVVFEAKDSVDILIAVSDFSHFYSGMVYPPAFGLPKAVSSVLYSRFLFRAAICACAVTIGLLAILIGLLSRRMTLTALYGLLCLFYTGYACYPVMQTLIGGSQFLYTIENFSFCAMLLTVMLLIRHISGTREKWGRIFLTFGAAVSVISLLLPFALAAGSLPVMTAYSSLISFYEWAAAGYIAYAAIRGALNDAEHMKPILCGAAAFTAALAMDRILPLYEPVITGWFIELASFVLILSVGVAIGREVAAQYRDRAVLQERAGGMERLLSLQRNHYEALQKEIEAAKNMRHDMRHHFNMIGGFVRNRQYEELEAYISSFGANIPESGRAEYSANNVLNVLAHYYAFAARQNGIAFDFRCEANGEITMPEAELCGLLSNLLENAVEACRHMQTGERYIQVAVAQLGKMLSIHMENSVGGSLRPAGHTFLSTKDRERTGYGLASVRTIAQQHGGTADFKWNRAKNLFTSDVTLLM